MAQDIPLPEIQTLGDVLRRQRHERPQAIAISFQDTHLSYGVLSQRAARVANALLALGAIFVLFYTWPLKYVGLGEPTGVRGRMGDRGTDHHAVRAAPHLPVDVVQHMLLAGISGQEKTYVINGYNNFGHT